MIRKLHPEVGEQKYVKRFAFRKIRFRSGSSSYYVWLQMVEIQKEYIMDNNYRTFWVNKMVKVTGVWHNII